MVCFFQSIPLQHCLWQVEHKVFNESLELIKKKQQQNGVLGKKLIVLFVWTIMLFYCHYLFGHDTTAYVQSWGFPAYTTKAS